MAIDPRLADRRKVVAEDRARHNVKRLLRFIGLMGVVSAIVWLLLSPTFSVSVLEIEGVQSSGARETLSSRQVVEGRPLVLIRAGDIEAALLEDPWIESAEVDVDWPSRVVVSITERTPAAWVKTGSGWSRRAVDGVILPGPDKPDSSLGRILLPKLADDSALDSATMLGALEFLETLPIMLSADARVQLRDDELWAVVAGYDVRLGRPVEMAEKALSTATLLKEEIEPGSIINVIAPTNPAISPPG